MFIRYFDLSGYAIANPTDEKVIAKSVNRGMKDAEICTDFVIFVFFYVLKIINLILLFLNIL